MNQPFHASTEAAMLQHYRRSTRLFPIGVMGLNQRTSVRFTGSHVLIEDTHADVVALFWAQFETSAKLVVSTAYSMLDDYDVQKGGEWRRFPASQARHLIEVAARWAKVEIISDSVVAAHARQAVQEVNDSFDRQRRDGTLRSVNRHYRDRRVAGADVPSYGAYVLDLKRKALAGLAERQAPAWFQASASTSPA